MKEGTNLIRVFTGEQITVVHLKSELEKKGIAVLTKDGFTSGISAGFGGGMPAAIDLFIQEADLKKAADILNEFNSTN